MIHVGCIDHERKHETMIRIGFVVQARSVRVLSVLYPVAALFFIGEGVASPAPLSRRGSAPVTLHSPEQLAFIASASLARRSCTGEKAGTVNTRFRAAQDAHEAPHVRLGAADRKRRRGRRRQLPCPLFGHVPTWS